MTDLHYPDLNAFPLASEAAWRSRVESVLKGADFNKKLVGRTHDGLAIQPLYPRKKDAALVTGATSGKPWQVMTRVDHPDCDAAARLACEDLEGGADALALVFPGERAARGYGLSCETLADLEASLAGVRIDLIQVRLDPSLDGCSHALTVADLIERRKLAPAQMAIDFGMDPIGTLTHRGQVSWDWSDMASRLGQTVTTLLERGFKGPFLTVDLRSYHEAGASEGQELGAGLAQAVLYLRTLERLGLPLDRAAQAISFLVAVDADQFMGIAKLRALRRLWGRVQAACGLTPHSAMIHAETAWRMLTRRDPHVNILRSTVATFAAGIGGADSVTVLPFTSALCLPDAAARRLARNTSIVLQEESSLWRVADPAAGAGGFEALTNELASRAWTLFQQIESEGGLMTSLVAGKLQGRIAEVARERAKAAATRKEPITGTSEFANLSEIAPDVLDVKPYKSKAQKDKNHKAGTRAEILPSHRVAEPFEALRDRADAILKRTGSRPEVMFITLGPLADHAARLAFTRNAFETGGFAVKVISASEARNIRHRIVCFVGSDKAYADEAITFAASLPLKKSEIWLAGRPGDLEAGLTSAGVKRYLYAGCDLVACLNEAQNVSHP
jgi:methylmalonyl-CoA mutase